MGIRVLSGVHFLEVLAYLLPMCNENVGPVTPSLIFPSATNGLGVFLPDEGVNTYRLFLEGR
ncbi:hypothetical protein Hdeb2414_s0003g00102451 [Helianthus debilis subsp. tardiflorus]